MKPEFLAAAVTEEMLDLLLEEAVRAGRQCVVGALVKDDTGSVFCFRRALDRQLFPGAWDIPGGRVEPGESLRSALAREIAEETGWTLLEMGRFVARLDWQLGEGPPYRELDFTVTVEGDLQAPRLEQAKVVEGRWISRANAQLLLENREPGDSYIHDLVLHVLS